VACAAVAAVAIVTFGGPINVGGPATASAVTAALQWFDPPAGTVLHTESRETTGARSVRREFWQSVDHPDQQRLIVDVGAGHSYELAGPQLYDPATNTIYERGDKSQAVAADPSAKAGPAPNDDKAAETDDEASKAATAPKNDDKAVAADVAAAKAKRAKAETRQGGTEARQAAAADGSTDEFPAGDPLVAKIRFLLRDGRATVTGHELHRGVDAWVISLNDGLGRPPWTLWVDRADGRPLEAYDPGRTASAAPQTIRWTTYEVRDAAEAPLSLDQAHPSAQHVRDLASYMAAEERLLHTP
jgi:hypothetical protein